MNFLFLFFVLTFFILLPPMIIFGIMIYLSTRFKLEFKVCGPFKYRDIMLDYENEYFSFLIRIDLIHLYLIWLKLRMQLKGVYFSLKLNSKILRLKYYFTGNHNFIKEEQKIFERTKDNGDHIVESNIQININD